MPHTQPQSDENQTAEDIRALLAGVAENLSAKADHALDLYHREAEVQQVLQALASPIKGRVVVVGPTRAGKSAVIQAVAQRLAEGACPPELQGREIWRLTPSSLPGLSARGNWQMFLDQLMNLWARHPEIILYFDEITRAARLPGVSDEEGGGAFDVATALATALKRLSGLCLAEAEENAWRRFAEMYSDYGNLFLPVRVEALELPKAREVVQRVAQDLGILHGVTVSDGAREQALDLSQRYALDRSQPGKAIDILRDALAVAQTGEGKQLTAEAVIKRFGEQSGLPRMLLDDAIPFNEEEVMRYFKQHVLGQEQAVEAIVQALSLLRARVQNPLRPMGVFLFLGPTGVGKTELARTLAEYLYGNRDRLVRFNMADYSAPYQGADLFGNQYAHDVPTRRGQLTNRLAGKFFSVIVLDEFEKAHPLIYQHFLQLFDEGLLINGNDETINLRNAIFILTSNFGARLIEQDQIGFNVRESLEAREKRVLSETEEYFTPEFMNRIDAVCIFHPLNRAVMAEIARREISDLLQRDGVTRRNFEIDIADEVIEHVVEVGYSPRYGARYLKRQIEKTITYPLAREINALAPTSAGGTIRLYGKHGRIRSAYLAPLGHDLPAERPALIEVQAVSLVQIREALPILAARVEALEEVYRITEARAERDTILAEMSDVRFWNNQAIARRKLDAYQRASSTVDLLGTLRLSLDTLTDQCTRDTPSAEQVARPYKFLIHELPRIEFAAWLSGPHDANGAYLQITVKSKLTSARQWAATLAKMYLGWAKQRGLAANVLGEDQTPEGRTFTATLVISGFGVYGLLQNETGAHRLVQTVKETGRESLQRLAASVVVWPELDDDELPPAPAGLETSTKALARNGLLIARITSLAAVTHAPSERRLTLAGNLPADDLTAEAARLLRTALYLEAEKLEPRLPPPPGGIVRSYIRNTKDKGVHDHRTNQRTTKVKQVLDGEIQEFLDGALKLRA